MNRLLTALLAIIAVVGLCCAALADPVVGGRLTRDWRTYGMSEVSDGIWECVMQVAEDQRYLEIGALWGTGSDGSVVQIGVPQGYTVSPPHTDLLEVLPASYPEQHVRIRVGFTGYVLVRFDLRELRLTIRRMAVEPLPTERRPKVRRYLKEDVEHGC